MRIGKYIYQALFAATVFLAGTYSMSRVGIIDWPAHYDPLALPDLVERPYWLTQVRLKLIDADGQNCRLALSRASVKFKPSEQKISGASCGLQDAVQLSQLASAKIKTEDMRCNIAARLYMWDRNVVQPAASRIFGEAVSEILHFGAYSCRTIRGSNYLSEHATANAFDISGFRLQSGRMISVKSDWRDGKNSAFLRHVRDGLCDYFNLTLSPDYNADHKDHFHVDMGWVRGCN